VDLLYGVYERDSGGSLHHVQTGQRLVVRSIDGDRVLVEYRDREISVPVLVRLTGSPAPGTPTYFGREALVDWNLPQHLQVKEDYSRWRRLTWFLLDALLVWLIEEGRPERSVLALGGWFNGRWLEKGRFLCGGSLPERGAAVLAEEVPSYDPVALGMAPPSWHFEPGLPGAREGRLAVISRDGDVPVIDLGVPIERQLSDVPRFVGSHGSILFFHRVIPHVGPEYAPGMAHGLVGKDYAFYFAANHGTPTDTPVALRPGGRPYPPRLREQLPEYLKGHWAGDRWRLHPVLREEQYFVGAEAYALFFERPYETWPMMRSLEHDQKMPFGFHLGEIGEPPISVGLRAGLRSWPRLSSEPPEDGPQQVAPWWRRLVRPWWLSGDPGKGERA
jgi:hypothetical protein